MLIKYWCIKNVNEDFFVFCIYVMLGMDVLR